MKENNFFVLIAFLLLNSLEAKCPEDPCESGTSCDYNTGLCQRFRIPDGFQLFDNWNKCEYVKCPPGFHCDGTSGVCARKSSRVQLAVDYCDGIECPPDFTCVTGRCVKGLNQVASSLCKDISCPRGYVCSTPEGICRKQAHSDIPNSEQIHEDDPQMDKVASVDVKCPPNSHFQACGSPCTFTCTEVQPPCKQNEHECVKTCSCDDGYVQASTLNTTCVKAQECIRIANDDAYNCEGLKCSQDMKCLNGHCNPSNCPQIMKPAINAQCNKIIVVRDRRNCIVLINQCDLYTRR
ncbi:hypothetical protein M3Y97_00914200 [Aphelenchoides bicaudatus]|nr:hypothetical protein M3Y97_00914200 [Aphelenchoides bicaudatus]